MLKKLFLLVLPLLFAACDTITVKKTIDPKLVDFHASYNSDFDNVLYTSMLLALSNNVDTTLDQLFKVSVTAPKNNSVMRIVADSTILNYVSITQEILPKKGQTYTFTPVIRWKYETLYRLRQPGNIDLTFTCYINDEEVDVKNIHLNYRSVNECLLSLIDSKGDYHDYRWLFTAFVNEDHPKIDNILSEILQQGIVTKFDGAGNSAKVDKQMRAIWFYALNRGITYSTISCTSNGSRTTNSQYIRFFDDVYKNRQANCIDACVFFSSIMRKVGLYPIIFVEPCHAYLGYYTDKSKKKIALLETTFTSWVNLPSLDSHYDEATGLLEPNYYEKIAPYLDDKQKEKYAAGKMSLDDIKKSVSGTLFNKASVYQMENYMTNLSNFNDSSKLSYQILIIDELRKKISPIPAMEE